MAHAGVTATISGVVRDPSGAVVPGAQVIARNQQTGTAMTVVTDAQGFYSLQGLPVDTYEVEITKAGIQEIRPVGPGALCQRCPESSTRFSRLEAPRRRSPSPRTHCMSRPPAARWER